MPEQNLVQPEETSTPPKVSQMALRLGTLGQIVSMLGRGHRWWLIPLVMVLGLVGLALAGLQAVQYVAPFIYAVF